MSKFTSALKEYAIPIIMILLGVGMSILALILVEPIGLTIPLFMVGCFCAALGIGVAFDAMSTPRQPQPKPKKPRFILKPCRSEFVDHNKQQKPQRVKDSRPSNASKPKRSAGKFGYRF